MLNCLTNATMIDVYMAVYQCTRFSIFLKPSHEKAVKRAVKCLAGTKGNMIKVRSESPKGIEVNAESDFASI